MKRNIKIMSIIIVLLIIISCISVSALSGNEITCIYPGDANGNNLTTIDDVTQIQQFLADVITDKEIQITNSDFNGDNRINIIDATDIQKKLAKLDYNCFIYPDENYLEVNYSNSTENFPNGYNIEFETLLNDRDLFYPHINPPSKSTIALITSKEEYFSLMNYYSPCFDDEFFTNKALIIGFKGEYDWETENSISAIGVSNNTLYIKIKSVFTGDDPTIVSPAEPTWLLYYSVNKSDIANVKNIVSTYK